MSESRVLVVGFAMTGRAVASFYAGRGVAVRAVDDLDPCSEAAEEMRKAAEAVGADLELAVSNRRLAALAASVDRVVLSPGVPPAHPVFALAPAGRIVSEIQLGSEVALEAGIPLVAVTGTNGKTTVTSLVTAMLQASGRGAVAAGNIGRPLVEAASEGVGVEAPPNRAPEVIVVEASSFQLAWTTSFRPAVACWLNFAPDHLDWHHDLDEYARAKARIWRNQEESDAAVWNAEDEVVASAARQVAARSVPFGLKLGNGAYREANGRLLTPAGDLIAEVAELPRGLPHDRSNALAAAASALEAGATVGGCRAALMSGVAMPHRIELVAERSGVKFYDDSKATTPSAVAAALAGFASVVLIAGGRNKGLDLGAIPEALVAEELAGSGPGTGRLRGVVAIGEAQDEVVAAFSPFVAVERASTMHEAVAVAVGLAEAGDAVLLSPGCASFDWYRSYGERGDDFSRAVRGRLAGGPSDRRRM